MFEISPDHAIGLYFGLLAVPAALIVMKLRRPRHVPGTTLGLVLVPVRGETGRPRRAFRWGAIGVALPLLTLVTTSVVWIDDLARPDAQHVHAGAVLQPTNDVATPDQVAAAQKLYDETL